MFGLFCFLAMQETNAVHVNVGAGSYLEINIPMTVSENGELRQIFSPLLFFLTSDLNSCVCECLLVFLLCNLEMYIPKERNKNTSLCSSLQDIRANIDLDTSW